MKVQVEADVAGLGTVVPPLILQPLVENAVRHGIADRPEGGSVAVSARVEGERLVLRVIDDGTGGPASAGDGLGMSSVRRRLAAAYGGRATFSIDRMPKGFAVTIGLPFDPPQDVGSAA